MAEQLGDLTRTHTCGALRPDDVGADVVLLGWVHRVRDLGGLLFVDVRDRAGVTQVVFDKDDEALMAKAKRLRSEFVDRRDGPRAPPLRRDGQPEARDRRGRGRRPPADAPERGEDAAVPDRRRDAGVGGRAPQVPLPRSAPAAAAEQHRPAPPRDDGRSGSTSTRTASSRSRRRSSTKSTPEGARDYLVPSRVHPGEFFALPQSPQLFKQILMIAGMDRYVQICKCFRDEDLRADRQPEFTQVDVEMSFARPETIFGIIEPLMREIFAVDRPRDRDAVPADAVRRGDGEVRLRQAGPALRHADPGHPRAVPRIELPRVQGDRRRAAAPSAASSIKNAGGYSRSEVDGIVDQAKQLGAAGLIWARRARRRHDHQLDHEGARRRGRPADARRGVGAATASSCSWRPGEPDATSKLLGQLRLNLAKKDGLLNPDEYRVHLGRGLSLARVGPGGEALRRDAPPVHVAARRGHGASSTPTRARRAPRPTTWC